MPDPVVTPLGVANALRIAGNVFDQSGEAMDTILQQQGINRRQARKITRVMDEYIEWFERGGVSGLDDADLAYIGWIAEGFINNPEAFPNARRAVIDTMEGVPKEGLKIEGQTIPRPQNQGPTQGSTVSNTSLYEAAQGLGGIDPATGEGKIGTISISDNPLNTPRKQLAGQAGVQNPYDLAGTPIQGPPSPQQGPPTPAGSGNVQGPPTPTGPTQGGQQQVATQSNWLQDNAWWLAPASTVVGAGITAYGSKSAADDLADAVTVQGKTQDKLSRDVLQTGLEIGNEMVDIGLGLGEPFRIGGIAALAGMADMLGLDRTEMAEFMGLPPEAEFQATDRVSPSGQRQFGWKAGEYGFQTPRGQFTAAPEKQPVGAGGETLYQPEYDYNRQRIDKATNMFYGADEFDWKEPLREAGFSFSQGGTAGFMSIFSNLATLAGFGPQQAPNEGTGQGAVANAGNNLINSADYISGAGSAVAQGTAGAYNAFGNAANSVGQQAGWLWGKQPWSNS